MIGAKLLAEEAALRADPKESDSIDTLKCVVAACESTKDFLNDILCFDKMDSRTLDLRTQPTAIIPFLSDCLNIFAPIATEKKIELRSFFENEDVDSNVSLINEPTREITHDDFIDIDTFKMRQVIRNILSNALKFTQPYGQITLRAWITNKKKKLLQRNLKSGVEIDYASDVELVDSKREPKYSTLTISVKDSGAGFDEVQRNKVFKEVFQFKPEVLQGGGGRLV